MSRIGTAPGDKGHLRGGLFCVIAAAALAAGGCSPGVPAVGALPPGLDLDSVRIPNPLAVYDRLDFIVGDLAFPAVGRFVFLPGPADSTYAIFTLSIPNNALRFRRAEPGFLARYNVRIVVGSDVSPTATLETAEEVRVRSFRETARRDESVIFQGFLLLPPGDHAATIQVRDPASGDGLVTRRELSVPRFAPGSVSAPIVVYRARPRSARREPPALIINPRATVALDDPAVIVYREALGSHGTAPVLELFVDDTVTLSLSDTVGEGVGPGTELWAAVDSIAPSQLPAGTPTLRVRSPTGADAAATLVVGLTRDWIAADYAGVLSYLRYAGTAAQLDSLRTAPPRERARLLHAFWKRRDPDPETAVNEFFAGYFRRIQDANNRFPSQSGPGWLTDRGMVYVILGPPDRVARHLDTREGPGQSQVWLYDEDSLGFKLRLVFLDQGGIGEFRLSNESRRAFQEAVLELYS